MENVVLVTKSDLLEFMEQTVKEQVEKAMQFPFISERKAMELLELKDKESFRNIMKRNGVPVFCPPFKRYFYNPDDIAKLIRNSQI